MLINYLSIILVSFFAGIIFIFLLRKLALKYKWLNFQGMPLIGGISMALSFLFAYLFISFVYGGFSADFTGILIASFIILVFGVIDDQRELSIRAKFLAQIIATFCLVSFGIRTQIINIGNPLNIIITFLWILGITNALNHLDVIDGLAGGTVLIVAFSFWVISFLNGDIKTVFLSLALAGAVLSFLIYNLPPAKIYMGNAGSHFLGFVLAGIALAISYAPLERKIALLSPLLILGFPIFDTVFLILMRISKKKLPFKKSNDHLALRFLAMGYSKKKALWVMLSLCSFFAFCGILLSQTNNNIGMIIIFISLLTALAFAKRISKVTVNG